MTCQSTSILIKLDEDEGKGEDEDGDVIKGHLKKNFIFNNELKGHLKKNFGGTSLKTYVISLKTHLPNSDVTFSTVKLNIH